jgi:beta-lactamase class A
VTVASTVSVQLVRVGADSSALAHDEHALHPTASTMKLVVLIAYLRAVAAGSLDAELDIVVHKDFPSSDGVHRFEVIEDQEDDLEPWRREHAPLRWLVERMITHSSNLATDLVIEAVGLDRVIEAAAQCHDEFRIRRGIDDVPGIRAGILNQVSAAALAATYQSLLAGRLLAPGYATRAVDLLARNTWNDEIPAGLPAGVRIAHKNGWDDDIRHDSGIVFPDDAVPYVLVVLTSGLADDLAQPLIADVSRWAWANRHRLDELCTPPPELAARLSV